ncbi:MAG: ABC transporter permease [Anaerolineae bacterium]|nr:ABC transporter permease [Anaerolineae bacterium]
MEIHARWTKILKDMWNNRSRSMLVILSIAVGVAAVGMITNGSRILKRDLYGAHLAGNPSQLNIYVSPFQEELVTAVEGAREVEHAEPRRTVGALVYDQKNWEDIRLTVIPDFDDIPVNQLTLEAGSPTPSIREVLLERQSAAGLGVEVGDEIVVEMSDERRYALTVSGIVHDLYNSPYAISGEASGFIKMETLEWLGETPYYTYMQVSVSENQTDKEYVLATGEMIRDRIIEPAGYRVSRTDIPGYGSEPGEHWAQKPINGFLLILQIMSVMAIFLSGGLVINTVTAILTQQIRQIGIMRSIGAVRSQITQMYVVNILVFAILGLILAIPLGLLGAWGIGLLAATFMNFNLGPIDISPGLLILQVVLAIVMPVAAALYPIMAGTEISIYDAVYQHGLMSKNAEKHGLINELLHKLRRLSAPILLSLRNTFRNKTRLAFTMVTLTLAGAMFISVFSTRTSLTHQISEVARYVNYDAAISTPGGVNKYTAEREALRIPGIEIAEGWALGSATVIHSDGVEGTDIELVGLPYDAATIDPDMIEGRWLTQDDDWQVVVNEDLLDEESEIHVGGDLILKIDGMERTYQVVGVTSKHLSGERAYISYSTFGKITGRQNEADTIRVRADAGKISNASTQDELADLLEERFENAQLSTSSADTQHAIFSYFTSAFDIILLILIIMAAILAIVGSLGLTGTMGINVLERTREIGVLRAVGASTNAVRQVVVTEGVVVGLISWLLGAILSAPTGFVLGSAVVNALFQTDLAYKYSFIGLGIWLVIIILIGVLASLAPARNAVLLTVREVLDYE